jgi:hypothetical protein
MATLLETEFFPKWTRALSEWLSSANASTPELLEEAQRWYLEWKTTLVGQLGATATKADGRIRAQLNFALEVMGCAASGDVLPTAPMIVPPPKAAVPVGERPMLLAARATEPGLKEILEELAMKNDILFAPTMRVHEGKAIFKFGETNVIVDSHLVLAFDSSTQAWRPTTLRQLVEANEGGSSTADPQ